MKTKMLLSMLLMFALSVTSIFAQGEVEPSTPVDFSVYVISFSALIVSTTLLTALLNTSFKLSGVALQITSWVTGILITVAAHYFNLGMFADSTLIEALAIGAGASLAANGVADTGLIQGILLLFGIKS